MSEEKNNILDLFDRLNWYYTNYRYEHKPDFISAEYIDTDEIEEKYQELKDFLINRPFDDAVFNGLEEDEQDFLHHLINVFEKIENVQIEEQYHLLNVQYPFMCEDMETLYSIHDFLLENDVDDFKKLYPQMTIDHLEAEINNIYLILTCMDEFFLTLNGDQTTEVDPEHCFAE